MIASNLQPFEPVYYNAPGLFGGRGLVSHIAVVEYVTARRVHIILWSTDDAGITRRCVHPANLERRTSHHRLDDVVTGGVYHG